MNFFFKSKKKEIRNKIKGVIYGHAIGDAIGLGTEFLSKEEVQEFYPKGYNGYKQIIQDSHRKRWERGEWTDDTDQMLCILESVLEEKQIDEKDIARRLTEWTYAGGRGLGSTVYNVISSPDFLSNPHTAAEKVWHDTNKNAAANGAVMRSSILGVWEFLDLDKVQKQAENVGKITHYDPRCVGSCVGVTYVIAQLLQNETDYLKLTESAIKLSSQYDERITEYFENSEEKDLKKLKLDETYLMGYTLKTLGAGFWALQQSNFKKAILTIVNEGGDADTNGAVAGGILGAKFGYSALPKDWIRGLKNKKKLDQLIKKLIALMEETGQI